MIRSLYFRFLVMAFVTLMSVNTAIAEQPVPMLAALLQEKQKIAFELSQPPARCIQEQSTRHPAFHGCIDWHSAVHATWSLVAYQAMTKDKRYAATIAKILSPEQLQLERQYLEKNPGFEMPYGRAWFLRLVLEYERDGGDGRLLAMGDFVATTLESYYRDIPLKPMNASYSNASWALINLLDYYAFRNQSEKLVRLKKTLKEQLLVQVWSCNPEDERPEFMSMCYNLAWLASSVLSSQEFKNWLAVYAPVQKLATTIKDIHVAHEYGLNFSRSWGLWRMYATTGKLEYANAYVEHFRAGYDKKSNWDGDYHVNGHWAAQFGMFAIQPLFGSAKD